MGAQQGKTRKLTLENDDPTSVIKVSDDVVQRLRCAEAKRRGSSGQAPPQQLHSHQIISNNPPPPFYHYEPTFTSLQIRQEAAEKLRKNDEYWTRRIHDLEKNNEKMRILMEEEYKKAMDEMNSKTSKSPFSEMPCIMNRKKVMECYQQYPNEPMRCAKEVQAFAACVDMKSIKVVENKR
ncbi:MICOS complex subunit Mic19 [Onthophagus taurus]|uniref:MICOS complex subunit Mic19 n=1 Tax=Onthophagus taurus TaxID=166361 RepID=UPI000C2098DE|nr:uncharacterized protein LOC111425736 [Onthophagus taurus]